MDRIIWVVEENRECMMDVQRKINAHGGMKAMCILSVDFLKKVIEERIDKDVSSLSNPSLIILDSQVVKNYEEILSILKTHPKLAGVPIFFMVSNLIEEEEEYYSKGAMVVVEKPLNNSSIIRIDSASWQYELSKNYERILQKQMSELEAAKEIKKLNEKLESRNEFLYRVFGKYFSDELIDIILEKDENELIGGERRDIAVLFSDLRGFTALAENMSPESVTDLLNCYFGAMSDVIISFGGTIIEFLGDGILAIFGAPRESEDYCENAIAAAINMQNAMRHVNEYCAKHGYDSLEMGIGVHCGEGFVGNVGTEQMMRYNCLGSVVNTCSRIESFSVGGQVLVSEDIVNRIGDIIQVVNDMQIKVKGLNELLKICDVSGIEGRYNSWIEKEDNAMGSKLKDFIAFDVFKMENKVLSSDSIKGQLEEFFGVSAVIRFIDGHKFDKYDDVEIRGSGNDKLSDFQGVYGKVLEVSDNRISLYFTHKKDVIKELDSKIKTGIIDIIPEWRADMKDRDDVVVFNGDCDNPDALFKGQSKKFMLIWSENTEDIKVAFCSDDRSIRAVEILDYIIDNYGTVSGDAHKATAIISKIFVKTMMSEKNVDDYGTLFEMKVDDYYEKCQWIFVNDYIKTQRDNIYSMVRYKKKRIPWACVKTTDIAADGELFKLKSLENETDLILEASDDMYIMIGCRGEIYNISADKFKMTYEFTDEKFDIYTQMPDYIPEVQLCVNNEYISLDDKAYLCYPKDEKVIYAKQTDCRTKVFSEHNKGEYFVGRGGDYIAVREDDISDVYIIQREIFAQTYEEVK